MPKKHPWVALLFRYKEVYLDRFDHSATLDSDGKVEVNHKGLVKYQYATVDAFKKGYIENDESIKPLESHYMGNRDDDGKLELIPEMSHLKIDEEEDGNAVFSVFS